MKEQLLQVFFFCKGFRLVVYHEKVFSICHLLNAMLQFFLAENVSFPHNIIFFSFHPFLTSHGTEESPNGCRVQTAKSEILLNHVLWQMLR